MKKVNQVPPKQETKQDRQGNNRCTIWYKDGNSTMLLSKNVPYVAAKVLETKIKEFLAKHNCKLNGTFLCK